MVADLATIKNTYITIETVRKELINYTTISAHYKLQRHLDNFSKKTDVIQKLDLRDKKINEIQELIRDKYEEKSIVNSKFNDVHTRIKENS